MPDKFYDYCAAGLAIINSLQGEVKDQINKRKLGLQYKAGNPLSLYESIEKLSDYYLLRECKSNAYASGEVFDLKNQMIPLVKMIDQLTENRKK
jgi:hypothetical protein